MVIVPATLAVSAATTPNLVICTSLHQYRRVASNADLTRTFGGIIVPVAATLMLACAFAFASMSTWSDAETFPQSSCELMRLTCFLNVSGLRSKVLFASMELSTTAEEPHQPMCARQNMWSRNLHSAASLTAAMSGPISIHWYAYGFAFVNKFTHHQQRPLQRPRRPLRRRQHPSRLF